jgi:hypothetical protein
VLLSGFCLLCSACSVTFPDGVYSCSGDADCADSAAVCVGTPKRCCTPSGPEICGDGIDNDCDGTEAAGTSEVCNGIDDNCDGRTDEGFNLANDPNNCGMCGKKCAANEVCTDRACMLKRETNCSDGFDDDMNGQIDCLDAACDGRFCGTGCACKSLAKSEANCADTMDNDGDAQIDCFDTDCLGVSCGIGCACAAAGTKRETACNDGFDNDGDMMSDCADSDCLNQLCTPMPLFFTCTAGGQCRCNGGQQVLEAGMLCTDGLDNDCNGKTDCAETACNGQMCMTDAGMGSCAALMCMP